MFSKRIYGTEHLLSWVWVPWLFSVSSCQSFHYIPLKQAPWVILIKLHQQVSRNYSLFLLQKSLKIFHAFWIWAPLKLSVLNLCSVERSHSKVVDNSSHIFLFWIPYSPRNAEFQDFDPQWALSVRKNGNLQWSKACDQASDWWLWAYRRKQRSVDEIKTPWVFIG